MSILNKLCADTVSKDEPTTYFIKADGQVADVVHGACSVEQMKERATAMFDSVIIAENILIALVTRIYMSMILHMTRLYVYGNSCD